MLEKQANELGHHCYLRLFRLRNATGTHFPRDWSVVQRFELLRRIGPNRRLGTDTPSSQTESCVVHVLQKVQLALQRGFDHTLVVPPAVCADGAVQTHEYRGKECSDGKVNSEI